MQNLTPPKMDISTRTGLFRLFGRRDFSQAVKALLACRLPEQLRTVADGFYGAP